MAKLNKLGVKNSLWNNIRAKSGSGKAPTKEMLEQEAKIKAEYMYGGEMPDEYGKGGYIVTRSHDRKGKTHKVTGPDGTVKYFGDSKLGQHPNDPARKKAFYARHAKNLKNNPYFRAFARKTWADGGYMDNPPNDMPLNLPLKEQNPYLVPEYNQPMANGYILPDINRPRLLPEVNASEYKVSYDTGTPDEIQIPTIVGGQYIGNNALERYRNTGEKFKTMKDPTSYSKYYDEYGKLHPKAMAIGGRMNQAQQLNAPKMRVGSDAPDGSVWKDIGAGAYGVLEGTLDTVSMGMTDKLTDAGYKGLQKLGGSGNTREQDMIRGFGNTGGAILGAVVNPASTMSAVNQGIKGLGQGVGNINENTQGIGNAISSMNGLIPSQNGIATLEQMGAKMSYKQGGLMHINEGGTHEQNALGGVPIGPNALVEQGETINNDFVFSDRLKPKGSKKTYAQLSKSVDTKYRLRPDDKLSKEAKQMDLDKLAAQQEMQKTELSNKYMEKAMAYGGKISCGCGGKMEMGGSFQGPISQSIPVTNGQNTLLAYGGSLMSNFMEPEPVYQNPANQYAMGGYADQEYDPSPLIMAQGGIHIKPENRGKFTASANRAGMGVQEFARHVLANKEDYSSTQVKRANFARNASKWKHAMGGNMYDDGGKLGGTSYLQYDEMGNPLVAPVDFQSINYPAPNEPDTDQTVYDAQSIITPYKSPVNIQSQPYYNQSNAQPQGLDIQPYNQNEDMYAKKMQGTNTNPVQNPYGEVGNTGYLTNLAGNLVKAGMVATSKPPIYNPSVKFGRMNANPAERLAMQEGRREIQGTKDIIRNNATSSGQYLTNASLMGSDAANKLAGTIGGIRQGYDQQNIGIGNQEAQLNQQITSGNNLAKEQFRDNKLNQYNKILDSVIGANQQRFAKDVQANNYQNQVLDLLKSGDYQIGFDASGKLTVIPTTK